MEQESQEEAEEERQRTGEPKADRMKINRKLGNS